MTLLRGLSYLWIVLLAAVPAGAAVLSTEDFGSDPSWVDRDAGEMAVSHNAGFGNGAGSLEGTFASQGVPAPETDAFRIDNSVVDGTGGPWVGVDYSTQYPNYSTFTFDFYSENVLPSTFNIRISDGTYVFTYNLLSQVGSVGVWQSGITVPLYYTGGWLGGGSSADFTNIFTSGNMDFIDIQVTRNGAGAQSYYLDNFTLNDGPIDPGGGAGSVPEASMVSSIFLGTFMIRLLRRRNQRKVQRNELAGDLEIAADLEESNAAHSSPTNIYRVS